MEENSQPQNEEQVQTEPVEEISSTDTLTGVITEPSATFESVSQSKKMYWVIPTIILIVVGILASYLITNDEELYSEIKTKQQNAVKKQLEESVKNGSMTKEQMQQQMEQMDKMMDKSNPFFIVMGLIGPIFGVMFKLFFIALVYWGLFKIAKGQAGYMMMINVVGLASVIEAIQGIINTVIGILSGKLEAGLNPAMILSKDSVGEQLFKFLAHIDILNIWYFIVLGIGFAIVNKVKTSTSLIIVFAVWLVWVLITSFVNIPFMPS